MTPVTGAVAEEAARIAALFRAAGAEFIEPEVLQPADVLLDLYGEDIRARAYVTRDDGGELMLRPDFTVPVVRHHMTFGAEPARYAYSGPVWRRQEAGAGRAREYLQVGFELFARDDPAATDAEVFSLVHQALAGSGLRAALGDMGLLLAAIDALSTTDQRKAALRRHMWRPRRFHRLLERYSAPQAAKSELLDAARGQDIAALVAGAGHQVGLRSPGDVAARIERLMLDAQTPPLDREEVALIEAVLELGGPLDFVARALRDLAGGIASMAPAIDRFEARVAAIAARGIDPGTLDFEGSFGRTTLEYYDGFVFGFVSPARPDLPAIASGGRYDALTRVLGGGTGIPAVGAIIRPTVLLEARR